MRQREIPRKWPLQQVLATARAVLAGEIGIVEGCIALASYSDDIVLDWARDPDFLIFGVIASDTDHLPFGDVRKHWGTGALARADSEIRIIVERESANVRAACEHVLVRCDGVETFP